MKSTAYDNTTAYDNISDEELGAKIRKSHQRHLENVKAHSAIWQKEGQAYRNVRENLEDVFIESKFRIVAIFLEILKAT